MSAMSNLWDRFDQNALNASLWSQFTGGSATFTYGPTGAQVNFPSSSTSSTDGDITSNSAYNLTGSAASLQVLSVASVTTFADNTIQLIQSAGNVLAMQVENGIIYAQKVVAGSQTNVASLTYNATTMKWWRIRESGGTIFWDYSADGLSWTNLGSVANPFAVTALTVNISGTCFQAETNPGTFKWNNFNSVPAVANTGVFFRFIT